MNPLALNISALVFLSACGGAQLPIDARGGMPQSALTTSSYKILYSFAGSPDGHIPCAKLAVIGGKLYGTTYVGGKILRGFGHGTVFSLDTAGKEHVLHRFGEHPDGYRTCSGLVEMGGRLYGTTRYGGRYYHGAVFSVGATGKEHVLYSFKRPRYGDGADPEGTLINVRGTLYGTTVAGGDRICYLSNGCGTVFSITAGGSERVLYRFRGGDDGVSPYGNLVEVGGMLYGTTIDGGFYRDGTVFTVSTTGTEHVLHAFGGSNSDGVAPTGGLINLNGTLYGTTRAGGTYNAGTVFSISTTGKERVLYSFGSAGDGTAPEGGVTAMRGTLYGTTQLDGAYEHGGIFSVSTTGEEHVLYNFGFTQLDSGGPVAGLVQMNGTLYGTTPYGGVYYQGTVYQFTPPR